MTTGTLEKFAKALDQRKVFPAFDVRGERDALGAQNRWVRRNLRRTAFKVVAIVPFFRGDACGRWGNLREHRLLVRPRDRWDELRAEPFFEKQRPRFEKTASAPVRRARRASLVPPISMASVFIVRLSAPGLSKYCRASAGKQRLTTRSGWPRKLGMTKSAPTPISRRRFLVVDLGAFRLFGRLRRR